MRSSREDMINYRTQPFFPLRLFQDGIQSKENADPKNRSTSTCAGILFGVLLYRNLTWRKRRGNEILNETDCVTGLAGSSSLKIALLNMARIAALTRGMKDLLSILYRLLREMCLARGMASRFTKSFRSTAGEGKNWVMRTLCSTC